jgi:hypothetical protein
LADFNLNSAIGFEQQRREDAKKALGTGKFGSGFAFTCEVGVSDFGEMTRIVLFSAFASSLFDCGIQVQGPAGHGQLLALAPTQPGRRRHRLLSPSPRPSLHDAMRQITGT